MRSKRKILKERAKNKRVRKEKARLRKLDKKKKSPRYITVHLKNLEPETMFKLKQLAKEKHISVSKLTRKLISNMIKEYETQVN